MTGVTVTTAKGNTFDISDLVNGAKQVYWYYDDDGNVTNGSVTLAIGDYVNYVPGVYTYTSYEGSNGYGTQVFNTRSYSYGWRVLGADEDTGELLIISEDLIEPVSGGYTDSTYNRTYFYLYGEEGYRYGVNELNTICSIYGNGIGATGARSINVDDINKITGYDPNTAGYGSGYVYEYGNEVTYTIDSSSGFVYYTGTKYPQDSTKASFSSGSVCNFVFFDDDYAKRRLLDIGGTVTIKSTDYDYFPTTLTESDSDEPKGLSTESLEYNLLFTNSSSFSETSVARIR